MKKITVFVMICSVLFALCACNNAKVDVTEPSDATPVATQPQENVTIDWETPIDIDDSFLDGATGDETEPADTNSTTGPDGDATEPTENHTEGSSDTTEPVVEGTEPPKINDSGAIELPFIPG